MGHPSPSRRPRQLIWGAVAGAVAAVLVVGGAVAWWPTDHPPTPRSAQARAMATAPAAPDPPEQRQPRSAPVRVEIGPPPVPAETPTTPPGGTATAATPTAPAAPQGAVVWIQAGHAEPREPGYRDQTGAGSGPFGNEIAFTTRIAPAVIARLRAAGIDARSTPGEVTPLAAPGAAFVSLHHDSPGGAAAFGHAIAGAGENYYRGEGSGDPSPTPYPDSAPHRQATTVSPQVEAHSRRLAEAIARRYRPLYTAANGAGGRWGGVQTADGNPRMMRYYGFYRTSAAARVIVEAGAAGADDAFLTQIDPLAEAIAAGILDHLGRQP